MGIHIRLPASAVSSYILAHSATVIRLKTSDAALYCRLSLQKVRYPVRYEIKGDSLPVVICHLDPEESVMTERGAMTWMSPNMEMQTKGTTVSKAFGRMFSGESIFQNIYTARKTPGMIAFSSSFPGSIKVMKLRPGESIIAQKRAFLAATSGVTLSTFFQRRLSSGFFSGEGFVMQKLTGPGTVFLEIDGAAISYNLQTGQQLVIDTGNLAVMEETCTMDIQSIKGIKNVLFGGEGMFNTVVTGPGTVTVQSMPISTLAAEIHGVLPHSSS